MEARRCRREIHGSDVDLKHPGWHETSNRSKVPQRTLHPPPDRRQLVDASYWVRPLTVHCVGRHPAKQPVEDNSGLVVGATLGLTQ